MKLSPSLAILLALAVAAPHADARQSGKNPDAEARIAAAEARFAAERAKYPRYYGPIDGQVRAGPALYPVLLRLFGPDRQQTSPEALVEALRGHILADRRIDEDERDLLVELGAPEIGRVTMQPADATAPSSGVQVSVFRSTFTVAARESLFGILDTGLPPFAWNDADRSGSVRQLATASFKSRDDARRMKTVLAAQIASGAPSSTLANTWQPVRGLISEAFSVINTFDEAQRDPLRHILADAVDEGQYKSGITLPGYLHTWIRPKPPAVAQSPAPAAPASPKAVVASAPPATAPKETAASAPSSAAPSEWREKRVNTASGPWLIREQGQLFSRDVRYSFFARAERDGTTFEIGCHWRGSMQLTFTPKAGTKVPFLYSAQFAVNGRPVATTSAAGSSGKITVRASHSRNEPGPVADLVRAMEKAWKGTITLTLHEGTSANGPALFTQTIPFNEDEIGGASEMILTACGLD